MPTIRQLTNVVKTYIARRGGTNAARQDLKEVQTIMRGPGSLADKARRSTDLLKTPGPAAETTNAPDGHAAASTERAGPPSKTATTPQDHAG
jgi:hypothetical protein